MKLGLFYNDISLERDPFINLHIVRTQIILKN